MQKVNQAEIKDEEFAFPSLANKTHGNMEEEEGSGRTLKLHLGLYLSCLSTQQAVLWWEKG